MRVTVYVEGGGNESRTKAACRQAFHLFFQKALGRTGNLKIVACGGRGQTHQRFCLALSRDPDSLSVLLLDAEGPVQAGDSAAAHLHRRDHWTDAMPAEQVFLMVQCMEAWFLADRVALTAYFGKGARESGLPGSPRVEEIPKRDLFRGLEALAKGTAKGTYSKIDGFEILSHIDPALVREHSPHAARLFSYLRAQLD